MLLCSQPIIPVTMAKSFDAPNGDESWHHLPNMPWGCYSIVGREFSSRACNLWRGWTPLWGQVGWRKTQNPTENDQNVWSAGSGKFWPCSNEVFGVSAPMFFEPFPKLVDDTIINLGNPWFGIGMDFKDLTMDVVLVHTQASFLGLQGIQVLLWDSDWHWYPISSSGVSYPRVIKHGSGNLSSTR